MLQTRKFEIVWHSKEKPLPFEFHSEADTSVMYNGEELKVMMN
jgi:hypothetical protein